MTIRKYKVTIEYKSIYKAESAFYAPSPESAREIALIAFRDIYPDKCVEPVVTEVVAL